MISQPIPPLVDLELIVGRIRVTYSPEFLAGEMAQARQEATAAPIAAIEEVLRALDRVSQPAKGAR